jgi:hypothetical protein
MGSGFRFGQFTSFLYIGSVLPTPKWLGERRIMMKVSEELFADGLRAALLETEKLVPRDILAFLVGYLGMEHSEKVEAVWNADFERRYPSE